ncbi:unnamed protein product [Fusarium equiseti]|uniref:Major facilitator superfamily (MFS) profile domain-containing protein n=1 Tax=Fusarium equiseti TaxID=61235 RepID=A0A8J2NEC7_FUSEQ|nr:unnamed protein product [Fusarium equiseti]
MAHGQSLAHIGNESHDKATASDGPEHLEAGIANTEISYDNNGLTGIIRSPYIFGAALLASFGGFSFGYDQGLARYGFNTGFMSGMLEFGAFVGCLFFPLLADQYSHKYGLAVATAFFCVGAIIQIAAHNYGTLVAGRTIGGVGVGTLAMGAPLYISEIAPPNLRGSLLVLEAISIVIGAIIAYWITYGCRDISNDWAFRLPFLLQMAPALIVGIGIQLFSFSPRWLAMRHRNEEAVITVSSFKQLKQIRI